MKPVYIGTSVWSYKDWGSAFYPGNLPQTHHFAYYATQFPTVEINNSFYRLPTPKTVAGWRDSAPEAFMYAVKGSRFITHMKKLANLGGALDTFFERIEPLQQKISIILWQLPRLLHKDVSRLDDFLGQLPNHYRYAVEFRHVSWEDEAVFKVLKKHEVTHVNLSSAGMPKNLTVTSNIIYIRFHGLAGGAAHNYTRHELEPWAEFIQDHPHHKVYAYFNNDVCSRAPNNAKLLMAMVGERAERAISHDYANMNSR
ncbi:DUF72 domain-containing protein [Pedosphaera parvula]|uniref:DUF72 domain-containing protein n=1 Tax=Pedosphaera parvula (strain Ellin514) TaxID=320771 RepID=B9XH92_PEDPL|nr:DUF72 domain-containing protein [Pedosphaera parvula]EEF60727.1 protein of unknown function DUF72 [Pedosphaera parvula Ellin514]